ncbi:quinone oxidoreductase family protein [Chitinilyticum litopenaei]|uniref:quinone oxidoreductase family protein n=1 Tax=Chitinilyticum litopenaei TaxID=1121276 RepID=UPI00041C4781|nr:quinone oxidoreductase [Chitinilyticum litopenaei]
MQTTVIRIREHGGPEVMQLETVALAAPGPGEVLLRQLAIGVNFIDTYHRSGLYPLPLPAGLGQEACGIVEAIGPGVSEFRPGDRVAYAGGATGAYATHRLMPAERLVLVPIGVPDEVAAATLLRGMTAQYLLKRTFPVKRGQTILFHAAAGGVGQIACQWARALGATVIGTAGSPDKLKLAARWCDHVINYSEADWVAEVRELTRGQGVPVVYDGVGAATFAGSLDCLAPRGMLVSFGNASGAVPAFNPALLAQKGSLFFTRPTLGHYIATRQELLDTANDYFHIYEHGNVRAEVKQRFALSQAAEAHRALEARHTTASTVLIPD